MNGRCAGHCCKAFNLPYSPEELDAGAASDRFIDGKQIAAMVIYLGKFAGPPLELGAAPMNDGLTLHYYGCRNLLPSGDCGAYETRPGMCRDFPYARPCPHPECELTPEAKPHVLLADVRRKLHRRACERAGPLTKVERDDA